MGFTNEQTQLPFLAVKTIEIEIWSALATRGRAKTTICFNAKELCISLTLIELRDVETVLASCLISRITIFNSI